MSAPSTPVLIVGAGLGGLSTALFLGLHGVPAVLIDRHPRTSRQPKARGQMPPIMEALRAAGAMDAILEAQPQGRPGMTIGICESVAGTMMHSFTEEFPDFGGYSPAPVGMASQANAERALAERATELGADLRFNTRLESFIQAPDGVHAVLRDLASDEQYPIRAEYLVAADGHRGTIAETAGIGHHGRGGFEDQHTVLFAADLRDVVADTAVLMYYIQNPELPSGAGVLVSTDTPGQYVAGMAADPDRTDAQTIELIRTITGVPDLAVELLDAATWSIAHRIADRFSHGRVHLVGDAAHVMPPTGGQGGNTALPDGYHLAWKLAAVVKGHAGPRLLDSHDAEQRPYGAAIADWQVANLVERQAPRSDIEDLPEPVDNDSLMWGYRRPAGAFVAEPGDGPLFEHPDKAAGHPGTRAPHVWLERDGEPVSTRDLFSRGFVLLTGAETWERAASAASARLGVPVETHRIGGELRDPADRWAAAYGITSDGAVLVRPDGVVAWRTTGDAAPRRPRTRPACRTGSLRRPSAPGASGRRRHAAHVTSDRGASG